MRHEKVGQEQHGHTPNGGWDDGWEPATKEESAKADTLRPPSLRSKIGDMAMTFAEWLKGEDTVKFDRPPDDRNNSGTTTATQGSEARWDKPDDRDNSDATVAEKSKDNITSLSELIETTLTPEQQQEVRQIAAGLTKAIVKDDQPASEELVEKLTAMEQPVRDLAIKEVLFWTQLKKYTDEAKAGFVRPISRVTQLLTDHQLFLENYDGLAKTTISFLEDLPRSSIDVDEAPYAYFVNGALNDRRVGQQIKLEPAKRRFNSKINDVVQEVILSSFANRKRDTKNLTEFARGLKNIGYDIASSDDFLKGCIDFSIINVDYPAEGRPFLQDNLYRAGLINDDNIGRLYCQLLKEDTPPRREFPEFEYVISLNICPESEVTKYWRQLQIAGLFGVTSPADNNFVTHRDIDSFRSLWIDANTNPDRLRDSDLYECFKDGIPDQSYYDQLAGAPILCDGDRAVEAVKCLKNMPLTSEILDILGPNQKKVLDIYREWEQKGALGTFFKSVNASDITTVDELVELSQRASSFLDKYPLANLVDRESVIDAHIQGKDTILGEEYFGDLVLYDCRADKLLSAMDEESIKQVRQHLDTLSRFDLFDGDRPRMVNYAVLAEEHWETGQLFNELANVSQLDEDTRRNLNLVLQTGNPYGIKTVEELENYLVVVAERADGDLVSNDVRDAYKAISFIMLSDFDGCNNANYFDLETLRRRQVLTPDDEAVIDLFRKVDPRNFGLEYDVERREYVPAGYDDWGAVEFEYDERREEYVSSDSAATNGVATEKLLQAIASSPLCVQVEEESGVAKIIKLEGAGSDLENKLRRYITDDWNKSLIDLEATGEGIEHLTIEEDNPKGAIEVVKLTGAPFKMLSHTIYGHYLRPDVFHALINDPGIWNTAQGSATISTSCIDERHCHNYLQVGSNESSQVLLGFNHIQPGGIVAMAPNDGYLRGSLELKMFNVQFTTCDELMRKFDRLTHNRHLNYNEVGLSRISSEPGARNGRLQPSHIIVHGSSTDDINENSKKFARYFGVPITLIDDEAYYRKYNAKPS